MRNPLAAGFAFLVLVVASGGGSAENLVEARDAQVVINPHATPMERLAGRMLIEMANSRGARWRLARGTPRRGNVIYIGSVMRKPTGASVPSSTHWLRGEGYFLSVRRLNGRAVVTGIGADERGCMFAAGHIIRILRWGRGSVCLPIVSVTTWPRNMLRGHQLGWRPTSNTYDRWGLKEYEQYIRELIVWGTNAIELIPFDSAYDRRVNLNFTCALADLIASYGLKVWLWYPIDDEVPKGITGAGLVPGQVACPSQPDGRRFILERRRELFARMRHLDAVFIPGGDPGGCSCERCTPWVKTLLPLAKEIADILHRYHPKAGLWLSNQGFRGEDNRRFYDYLRTRTPGWLAGVVHGPWAEETVQSMRSRTPARYPIRQYPDICHCVRCQYPVPDWDQAFAATLGREPVIYRPSEHAHIARMFQKYTIGAITYSDGVNDDLNKVIWSAVLWDPRQSDRDIVRDYVRCFFGDDVADEAFRGIYLLEANWRGPVLENKSIPLAFDLWRRLEAHHPRLAERNWRFQMALLRAYYDRYVQMKLEAETRAQAEILRVLGAATGDALTAARRALVALDHIGHRLIAPDLHRRLLSLGQSLFDSIGMQLSVSRWGASGSERGAVLDFLDVPLVDEEWIRAQLEPAVAQGSSEAVRAAISKVLTWEDPGPGGFYDDLGNPRKQPHLIRIRSWREDPGYVESTRTDFAIPGKGYRQSWVHYAESLFGAPIIMRYTGLDTHARYVLRATYSGRYRPTMVLWANGIRVHGPEPTLSPPATKEWPIPVEATRTGTLTLKWFRVSGRGAQVSEVWLMKQSPSTGDHPN